MKIIYFLIIYSFSVSTYCNAVPPGTEGQKFNCSEQGRRLQEKVAGKQPPDSGLPKRRPTEAQREAVRKANAELSNWSGDDYNHMGKKINLDDSRSSSGSKSDSESDSE